MHASNASEPDKSPEQAGDGTTSVPAPTPVAATLLPIAAVLNALSPAVAGQNQSAASTSAPAPQGLTKIASKLPSAVLNEPIFFEEKDSAGSDAADFAADLLAVLNTSQPAPATDLKATTKIDAPVQADQLPKLDLTSDAWLDQLARDITATASHDGKLSFRIVPPQLGKLDINIETRDAGVAVHMHAETREAQSIIAAAQPRLESALGQNGIRVAETSVASNGQENMPKPHFMPQRALIEAVNDVEHEADTPTSGRAAGRFA